MAFASAFKNSTTRDLILGQKGALNERTTEHQVLTLNNKLLQTSSIEDVKQYLDGILSNPNTSSDTIMEMFVTIFNKRSIRVGEGFRDLFYKMLVHVYDNGYRSTIISLIPQIPNYGFFRDYWNLIKYILTMEPQDLSSKKVYFRNYNPLVESIVKSYWSYAMKDNKMSYTKNPTLSWAWKYAPRQNGSEDNNIHWYIKLPNGKLYRQSLVYYILRFVPSDFITVPSVPKKIPTPCLMLYRKTAARISGLLNVPEQKEAANNFSEIMFSKATSKFLNKQRKALLNEKLKQAPATYEQETGNRYPDNPDRVKCRNNYLEFMMNKGLRSSTMEAHRLIQQIMKSRSSAEEKIITAHWKTLVETTKKMITEYQEDLLAKIKETHGEDSEEYNTAMATPPRPVLPMIDVSPSMTTSAGNGFSCMDVSMALGILASEILEPPYKNMALTFSSAPHLLHFVDSKGTEFTLREKINMLNSTMGYTTDILGAMKKVYEVASTNNVPENEIPDLVIFSDEGFDTQVNLDTTRQTSYYGYNRDTQNINSRWETTINKIDRIWQSDGVYSRTPMIYFWNLSTNSRGHQSTATRRGVSMLQGFNGSSFKFILTGSMVLSTQTEHNQSKGTGQTAKQKCALDDFNGMIRQTYYDPIRVVLSESNEGVLKDYTLGINTDSLDEFPSLSITDQVEHSSIAEPLPVAEQDNGWTVLDN